MFLVRKLPLLAAPLLIGGCMTFHDANISTINPDKDCGFAQGAVFQNAPYYLSKDKENAPIAGVSRLFGNYNKAIAQVKVTSEGNQLLALFYDADGNEVASGVSDNSPKKIDYKSEGGRFVIQEWSSCKPGEAAAGCVWSHIELSCTQKANLAVQEVTHGAGLIALLVPIVTSSSYLALYKRLPEVGSDANALSAAPGFAPNASHR